MNIDISGTARDHRLCRHFMLNCVRNVIRRNVILIEIIFTRGPQQAEILEAIAEIFEI